LRQVLPEADFSGVDDLRVTSCSRDSRRVESGDLFVALPGNVHDGRQFVQEAVWRGCRAVLAERPLPEIELPVCYVPDVRNAYGRVCQALAGDPSRHLKVVGITGTNGKTTTGCLIASVLATAGRRVGLVGTLGGFDGLDFDETQLTTPPSEILAAWLARMVANDCSHAVLEISSHALDQSRVAGITLDSACVTNVRRDHLDYHGSLGDYRLTKSRLLDHLTGEGFAVINADDPTSATLLPGINNPVLSVGIHSAAELTARVVERFASEQTFLLTAGSQTVPVRTRMIGKHHVYNCLVAAAVGLAYGADLATIVRGLENVEHVPGRLERLECGQPFGVFVDYAHTPDALSGSLQALREVVDGRLICVFGAGGDRDRTKRPLMGRAAEAGCDLAIITTDNPRSEDPGLIALHVLGGFRQPDAARLISDRGRAIAWALAQAGPGDCVLIAGKGHEKYQITGDRKIPFDDRDFARAWLYENLPHAISSRAG
jgi:UDP-N-acetylmuramoyl-L-alanyl-D-glutamate--2,6-diaminopimelate ligase